MNYPLKTTLKFLESQGVDITKLKNKNEQSDEYWSEEEIKEFMRED